MSSLNIESAYFGWSQPQHAAGCTRPAWDVDTRVEYDAWRRGGERHSCPEEECTHGPRLDEATLRLVCRSCGTVHLWRTEAGHRQTTTTSAIGYGQPPRRVGGLWLYPGRPLLPGDSDPCDYLATTERVDRPEPEHVVGGIGQGRGRRGGVIWSAGARPEIHHSHGRPPLLTYTVTSGELTFPTVTAAAKWVHAHMPQV